MPFEPRHLTNPARTQLRPGSVRTQFALVIGLLSFLPNVVVVMFLTRSAGISNHALVIGWLLLVALASGIVGYVLSLAMLRPLTRLTAEVTQGGPLDPHPDDPNEVRSLRGAFTGLLDRLTEERDRRNAFMATLVHDLKTPLIATGHLVRVLRDPTVAEEARDDIAARLLAENRRLLELVQHMADAHRFEREGAPVHLVPTDLHDVARLIVERTLPRAQARRLDLSLSGAGRADADPTQLDRALSNLVDNALRYARTSVHVHVTDGLVHVEDDGPGLPDSLDRLARPFNAQPVEIAGHRFTAGTAGLGLFIVRRIAEAHGGHLRYARLSDRSVFTVELRPPSAATPVTRTTLVKEPA
ncbi:sensor histidine kinase [Deinococcus pimensis]|uniref:sensor histidine kinase n=1 Tax=Deinococcus pimensis TaxID=309888 RepID=UPI0004BB1ABB|nr:HAMP domain-containing sensor histidine kinase [Deinococcus pimensis]